MLAGVLVLMSAHAFLTVWLSTSGLNYTVLRLWKEIIVALCAVPVVIIALRNPAIFKQFMRSRLMLLIVAFIALQLIAGAISYATGHVSLKALGYGLIVNIRFLVFFLLCAFVANRTDWLRVHWRTIVLVPAIAVIIFGLLQFFVLPADVLKHFGYGPDTIPAQSLIDNNADYPRVQSLQRGANPLGAYLVIVLTTLTVLIATRNHIRFWRILLLTAGTLCLLLTFSRSAWLGMAASGTLAVFLCTKTKRQRRIAVGTVIALVILFAGSLLLLNSNHRYQDIVFHTSSSSRASQSSNAAHASAKMEGLKEVLHSPLGEGPGTAGPASIYNAMQPARVSENYFLQVGQEVGWLGLALFVLILAALARGWYIERQATLNRVMLASLVGMVVISMLWHGFTDDTLAYIWWGLAGIAYGSQIAREQERMQRHEAQKAHKATKKA